MKRLFPLCLLSLLLCAVLLACSGSTSPTTQATPTSAASSTATTAATPQPTPDATNAVLASQLTSVITAYYKDIEARNYTRAYTYLDPQATDSNGKTITRSSFLQLAQSMDSEEGGVVSFDIGVFPPSTQVTMTVMRSHLGPYHAQLNMKRAGATWKISSLERI